jgi:rRNA-processing protein FCF1
MNNNIPTVIPDTNFLMDYPSLHKEGWLISPLQILILDTVVKELSGLTRSSDSLRGSKAQKALEELAIFRGDLGDGLANNEFGLQVRFLEHIKEAAPPLDQKKPDHQIIAYARSLNQQHPDSFHAVLSNDKELCDIAEALSVLVVSRHNERRFHEELQRKY